MICDPTHAFVGLLWVSLILCWENMPESSSKGKTVMPEKQVELWKNSKVLSSNELRYSEGAKRQQQRFCGPVVALTFNFMVAVGIIMANKLMSIGVGWRRQSHGGGFLEAKKTIPRESSNSIVAPKKEKAPPSSKPATFRGGKQKKKKWSKGKQKEKVNNVVLFDQGTYDKLLMEAPKYKLITPSILSDRLRYMGF